MMANKEEGCDVSGSSRLRLHIHPGTSGLAPHMALLAAGADFAVRILDAPARSCIIFGASRISEGLQHPHGSCGPPCARWIAI